MLGFTISVIVLFALYQTQKPIYRSDDSFNHITSTHKDLAWKLVSLMVEPEILAPWVEEHRLLPTQVTIGEGESRFRVSASFPYYNEMISVIPFAGSRPSIPGYPQIANYIKEALDAVYYGSKDPKEALDDAATKKADILGWVQ